MSRTTTVASTGAPDDEVHAFVDEFERPVGTYLYGRRMYETMVYWEHLPGLAQQPAAAQDFARIWRAADKIVYSRTLQAVTTARGRALSESSMPQRSVS